MLLAACGSSPKRSVYYQNDGPPDSAPANLADTADATPRNEPPNPRANRPYTALGRSFTPMTGEGPFHQRGHASWYGKQFHGNRTASGEIYDMFAMTAAHPTLPIPSYARVTNVRTGKSVIVRINDRGPFKDDRIIDLSYAAATRLGIVGDGTGEVEVDRITPAEIASGEWRRTGDAAAASAASGSAPSSAASASSSSPSGGRWWVQVGAFAQQANAEAFAARIASVLDFSGSELPSDQRAARVERDANLFRVLIGVLPDRASALALAQQLERLLGSPAVPFVR